MDWQRHGRATNKMTSTDPKKPGDGSSGQPKQGDHPAPLDPTETAHVHLPPLADTQRSVPSALPKRVGPYHIKRVIASGGMGVVYEATQERPRRTVALKLMKHGIASRSALRRFEYESQILARLRHPGIAHVYDAGTHRDDSGTVPYFAMEYIPNAKSITQYATDKKLTTKDRLKLFGQVCDAVHHGHQKGIIHRDLKPNNILVDSSGQVKIIDFGVARCTDSDMAVTTLQTDVGQLIGTLQYMSPEQCEADPNDIDTRSDVYALGVVFFELLAEQLPYNVSHKALHEATRVVREVHPTKLSSLNRRLRGDVETIALKALEKDRERRYQSASDFGRDIGRYLDDEPIAARKASVLYQMRVFARRNKAAFVAVVVIAVGLSLAATVSTIMYFRAEQQRANAIAEAHKAEMVSAFVQDILASGDPFERGDRNLSVTDLLAGAASRVGEQLSGQPEVEAVVRRTIANTYFGLGRYDEGEHQFMLAIDLGVKCYGENHAFVADTLHLLFWLLEKSGKFVDAESACTRALKIRRHIYGSEHVAVAESMDALGDLYRHIGRLDRAETLLRQAYAMNLKLFGDTTTDNKNNLALVLGEIGQLAEAATLFRECIDTSRRELGVDHAHTSLYMDNLARTLSWASKLDEAESWQRRALKIRQYKLGEDHPFTLASMSHLARILEMRGNGAEAKRLVQEAVNSFRRLTVIDNFEFGSALNVLGRTLMATGMNAEAEKPLREALDLKGGRTEAGRAWTRSLLGRALVRQRRFTEAEPLLLEAYSYLTGRSVSPRSATIVLRRVVELYETWDAAEPGKGYGDKATEWKAKSPTP